MLIFKHSNAKEIAYTYFLFFGKNLEKYQTPMLIALQDSHSIISFYFQ